MVCNVARRLSYYHDEEQLYCSSAGMDNYYPKSISRELKRSIVFKFDEV
jgi:hypothetical protein